MGNFNRDTRGDRQHRFGRERFGDNRNRPRPQMHSAICDSCGKNCEVPFRPTGEKPVYCSECFSKNGGGESRRNYGRDDRGGRDDREDRGQRRSFNKFESGHGKNEHEAHFEAINSKLDKILKLLSPAEQTPLLEAKEPKILAEKIEAPKDEMVAKKPKVVKKRKRVVKITPAS